MFSLVKYHNEKLSVVATKNVKAEGKTCIVKCNGGKYIAFLIKKSDDRPFLEELKRKMEGNFRQQKEPKCSKHNNKSSSHFLPVLKTVPKHQHSNDNDLLQDSNEKLPATDEDVLDANTFLSIIPPKKTYERKKKSLMANLSNVDEINEFSIPLATGIRKRSYSLGCSTLERSIDFQKSKNVWIKQQVSVGKPELLVDVNGSMNETENINFPNQFQCPQNEPAKSNCITESEESFSDFTDQISSLNLVAKNLISNHNSTSLSEIPASAENLAEMSSVNMEESATSEYIIESLAGTSMENSRNTQGNDVSASIIDVPIDITKISVPYSKNKSKKHFCIFCNTLQSKISRHMFLKHNREKEVQRAFALPVKSAERLKIIASLRKRGDFLHNTSTQHNSGILIVPRRQQSKFKNLADDYICCKKCKGFFSKKTLRIHLSKCVNCKNSRSNLIEGRKLTQFVHPVANAILKCKVFPTLRNDCVTKAIRYDELIIKFGNKLTDKYSAQHQHDMIRANLRLLGRFKIQLIKLEPNIKELKEIFKPKFFDKCVQAVRATAQWDDGIMGFKTPAVAQNITSLIKKCAKKQRVELIKQESEELKDQLEKFLLLWEEETPTLINKKALEDQVNIKRDKKVVMPSKEDINNLYCYLKSLINNAIEKLMLEFCFSTWTALVQHTLIMIQIFNRRRAGEIERLTVDNLVNRESITETLDKDSLKRMSKDSIKFAQQFVRITLRGKLGRTVSVLLCPLSIKAIDLILKHRVEAGITKENKFIFSRPTTSKLAKQYYRACPLLKKFSEECGAKMPESLRGTNLRKHIATYTALLNVEDAAVDKLANFMGHHKDIHKNIYRVSVPVAEITCVSKLLLAAIGDEEEAEDDNVTDDDNDEGGAESHYDLNSIANEGGETNASLEKEVSYSTDSFEGSQNRTSSGRKRRSTSPFGKTKRIRWNNNEKAAIFSEFGNIKDLEGLPSLKQCLSAISKHAALKNRTPQQLKSWMDNQRRYEKK